MLAGAINQDLNGLVASLFEPSDTSAEKTKGRKFPNTLFASLVYKTKKKKRGLRSSEKNGGEKSLVAVLSSKVVDNLVVCLGPPHSLSLLFLCEREKRVKSVPDFKGRETFFREALSSLRIQIFSNKEAKRMQKKTTQIVPSPDYQNFSLPLSSPVVMRDL